MIARRRGEAERHRGVARSITTPVGRHMSIVHPDLQVGRAWYLPNGKQVGVTDDYLEIMAGIEAGYPGFDSVMARGVPNDQFEVRRTEALSRFTQLVPQGYNWTRPPEMWDLKPVDLCDRRLGFCPDGRDCWVALDHTRQVAVLFTVQ